MLTLAEIDDRALGQRLNGDGLHLRTGPLVFAVRSPVPEVFRGLRALYADYPLDDSGFADFHVAVEPVRGWRRWLRPQLRFVIDDHSPFSPLPGDQGVPMLEWGMNWCVTGQCHQYLMLHAAVLAKDGRALVMPAPSGSGKSTLCAALLLRGWQLLSDELALIDPATGRIVPMPRPVSLKNASIDVIQRFGGPALRFGSVVHDTVKGRVGHFPAPSDALQRCGASVPPAWVVFPRYVAGAPARFAPLSRGRTVLRLIENAFNYHVHQRAGFELLADVVERSDCFEFSYGELDEAIAAFNQMASGERV